MTKREATIVLLATRTAWFPSPRSQFQSFGAVPGEKATERTSCRPCHGSGVVNGRQGVERCESCQGAGWYLVDGYTGKRETERKREGVLAGPERQAWRRSIDSELTRLRLQLETPSDVSARSLQDETPARWEVERDRHYRAGDYRALDLALERFAGTRPGLHQIVTWTYEYAILQPSWVSESAVDMLNDDMPDPVRVPHWHQAVSDETQQWRDRDAARRNVRPTAWLA